MRRRNMIAGAGAALIASPSVAGESTRLSQDLPDGTRQVAGFVNLPDKRHLLRLVDRPPNYETPIDVFSSAITPNNRFFVRYHLAGVPSAADMNGWSIDIDGDAVERPVRLTMSDLRDLPTNEVAAVCQCAGNRRGLTLPHVAGVEWGDGAMGCALWRGPTIRDILKAAGVKSNALEVWLAGADKPPLDSTPPFHKSLPIERALNSDTILAIAMNNAPIPLLNGFPARLVVPGWVGTYWMKHLTRITVSSTPLKSIWMQNAYRVPKGMFPVDQSFQSQLAETTVPITDVVVNSLIADPLHGDQMERSGFTISGVAWDRGSGINGVEVSLNGGETWQDALLDRSMGRYAFRRFSLQTGAVPPGSYNLMSRATSQTGEKQVDRLKINPGGYHNNLPREIAVTVV